MACLPIACLLVCCLYFSATVILHSSDAVGDALGDLAQQILAAAQSALSLLASLVGRMLAIQQDDAQYMLLQHDLLAAKECATQLKEAADMASKLDNNSLLRLQGVSAGGGGGLC